MKKHYYIKSTQPKIPIMSTLLMYLVLDKFNAPEWIWGVIGFVYLCYWILNIFLIFNSKGLDINDLFSEEPKRKTRFQERLEEMAKQRQTLNN